MLCCCLLQDDGHLRCWMQATEKCPPKLKKQGTKRHLLHGLKICSTTRNLQWGKQIHDEAIKCGHDSCIYLATALVQMYAKCGRMTDARQAFETIQKQDKVSWTALILGYAENGDGLTALDMFTRMKSQGFLPNAKSYVAAIKACASLVQHRDGNGRAECAERGKEIHFQIGCHLDTHVQNSLIDMYSKCWSMIEARLVFDNMKQPDVVSWNALILGYAENGESITALELFAKMKSRGCAPDSFSHVAALKACALLAIDQDVSGRAKLLERGKQIHSEVGCQSNMYVKSTLIDMYAKCGSMIEAHKIFDGIQHADVVSWNALLLGYADNGQSVIALNLFEKMKSRSAPDTISYAAALKACGLLGALESGRKIHAEIDRYDVIMLVTCVVDFYAKCGSLTEAQKVFDSHPSKRDVETYTALLTGYSRFGDKKSVFELFEKMQDAGLQPNGTTFICILTFCSHAGLIEEANDLFIAMPSKYNITPTVEHYNCMLDVLGRSNKLDDAMELLKSMPCRPNSVTWMTILGACRKWKNVQLGRLASKSLMSLDAEP